VFFFFFFCGIRYHFQKYSTNFKIRKYINEGQETRGCAQTLSRRPREEAEKYINRKQLAETREKRSLLETSTRDTFNQERCSAHQSITRESFIDENIWGGEEGGKRE
jgi:hypothetical protein